MIIYNGDCNVYSEISKRKEKIKKVEESDCINVINNNKKDDNDANNKDNMSILNKLLFEDKDKNESHIINNINNNTNNDISNKTITKNEVIREYIKKSTIKILNNSNIGNNNNNTQSKVKSPNKYNKFTRNNLIPDTNFYFIADYTEYQNTDFNEFDNQLITRVSKGSINGVEMFLNNYDFNKYENTLTCASPSCIIIELEKSLVYEISHKLASKYRMLYDMKNNYKLVSQDNKCRLNAKYSNKINKRELIEKIVNRDIENNPLFKREIEVFYNELRKKNLLKQQNGKYIVKDPGILLMKGNFNNLSDDLINNNSSSDKNIIKKRNRCSSSYSSYNTKINTNDNRSNVISYFNSIKKYKFKAFVNSAIENINNNSIQENKNNQLSENSNNKSNSNSNNESNNISNSNSASKNVDLDDLKELNRNLINNNNENFHKRMTLTEKYTLLEIEKNNLKRKHKLNSYVTRMSQSSSKNKTMNLINLYKNSLKNKNKKTGSILKIYSKDNSTRRDSNIFDIKFKNRKISDYSQVSSNSCSSNSNGKKSSKNNNSDNSISSKTNVNEKMIHKESNYQSFSQIRLKKPINNNSNVNYNSSIINSSYKEKDKNTFNKANAYKNNSLLKKNSLFSFSKNNNSSSRYPKNQSLVHNIEKYDINISSNNAILQPIKELSSPQNINDKINKQIINREFSFRNAQKFNLAIDSKLSDDNSNNNLNNKSIRKLVTFKLESKLENRKSESLINNSNRRLLESHHSQKNTIISPSLTNRLNSGLSGLSSLTKKEKKQSIYNLHNIINYEDIRKKLLNLKRINVEEPNIPLKFNLISNSLEKVSIRKIKNDSIMNLKQKASVNSGCYKLPLYSTYKNNNEDDIIFSKRVEK